MDYSNKSPLATPIYTFIYRTVVQNFPPKNQGAEFFELGVALPK